MPCYYPISAYRSENGGPISFRETRYTVGRVELPCGRCIGCRLERSRQWAVRCMHEAQMHEQSSFVTLTYRVNPVTLRYVDFQKFVRRVRKKLGKVRYFVGGEYGEELQRPHWHALLFGIGFGDRVYYRTSPRGDRLYQSATLQELWPYGIGVIGDVTFESAAYVARYCLSKRTGEDAVSHYRVCDPVTGELIDREPELGRMSLKPGIGVPWLDRFGSDVYPGGDVVVNGVLSKAPRAYDRWYEDRDPDGFGLLQKRREDVARARGADGTPERLAVREKVKKAQVAQLKRALGGDPSC